MISKAESKTEPAVNDPERLARQLQLELLQQRAKWQYAREKGRSMRLLAYGFIFLVALAALVGFFLVFTGMNREGSSRQEPATSATEER